MVFRENAPRPPPSPRAPRYPATRARNAAAKLQRPRAMRLIWSIACERAPLNRDRNAANLGEHMKRKKETREPRTDRGLSLHRFFQTTQEFARNAGYAKAVIQIRASNDAAQRFYR